jgi:hypothetical protein
VTAKDNRLFINSLFWIGPARGSVARPAQTVRALELGLETVRPLPILAGGTRGGSFYAERAMRRRPFFCGLTLYATLIRLSRSDSDLPAISGIGWFGFRAAECPSSGRPKYQGPYAAETPAVP